MPYQSSMWMTLHLTTLADFLAHYGRYDLVVIFGITLFLIVHRKWHLVGLYLAMGWLIFRDRGLFPYLVLFGIFLYHIGHIILATVIVGYIEVYYPLRQLLLHPDQRRPMLPETYHQRLLREYEETL